MCVCSDWSAERVGSAPHLTSNSQHCVRCGLYSCLCDGLFLQLVYSSASHRVNIIIFFCRCSAFLFSNQHSSAALVCIPVLLCFVACVFTQKWEFCMLLKRVTDAAGMLG